MHNSNIKRLISLCFLILFSSFSFGQKAQKPTKEITKYIDSLNLLSENSWSQGDYIVALKFANRAKAKAINDHYLIGEAYALNNIGIVYDFQGKYAESLENYFKAIPLQVKAKDDSGLSYTYNNIGLIYSNQKNYKEALKYYKKAEKTRLKINDSEGLSSTYNNLGILYMYSKDYQKALDNYFLSIEMDKKLNNDSGLSASYSNIGLVYMDLKDFDLALKYFNMALEIRKKENDKYGIANSYNNLSTLFQKQKQYELARNSAQEGLNIGLQLGSKELIQYSYQQLYQIEEESGSILKAYDYYKNFIAYGDSILNENNTKKQTQAEMQFQFDQEQLESRNKQEKKELIAKQEKQKMFWILLFLSIVIVLAFIFSWLMLKRWRIEKSQKQIIEQQKTLVELKNREITDSITYAKRIQTAILPPEKLVKEYLINSFILYEPKDIVAGDFYWMEPVEDELIFAVADCTGHGVPGALVSVVCHNALNRSVREFGLRNPSEILNKTRSLIIDEFEKSEDIVNDGMDISLCKINLKSNKLEWSGANSPLWILRKDEDTIVEIKPTKQPIGKFAVYSNFEQHTVTLYEGDMIYLFTDGFADQFGGDQGKKMKASKMKEVLISMRYEGLSTQQFLLATFFEQWKQDFEQLDDVCVIGLKI